MNPLSDPTNPTGRPAWMNMKWFGCLVLGLIMIAAAFVTLWWMVSTLRIPANITDKEEAIDVASGMLTSVPAVDSQDAEPPDGSEPTGSEPESEPVELASVADAEPESAPEEAAVTEPVDEETESDDSVPISVESCVATTEDYSWEFFDIRQDLGNNATRCLGNFRVQNSYDDRLLLFTFLERSAGSSGDQSTAWSRGKFLEPGDVEEMDINYTVYDNGENTFKLFTKLFVMVGTNECRALPEFASETTYEQFAVTIENPCLK